MLDAMAKLNHFYADVVWTDNILISSYYIKSCIIIILRFFSSKWYVMNWFMSVIWFYLWITSQFPYFPVICYFFLLFIKVEHTIALWPAKLLLWNNLKVFIKSQYIYSANMTKSHILHLINLYSDIKMEIEGKGWD